MAGHEACPLRGGQRRLCGPHHQAVGMGPELVAMGWFDAVLGSRVESLRKFIHLGPQTGGDGLECRSCVGLVVDDRDGRPGGAHRQRRGRQTTRPHSCFGRHDHVGRLDITEGHARGAASGKGEQMQRRRDVEAVRSGRHHEEQLLARLGHGARDERVA